MQCYVLTCVRDVLNDAWSSQHVSLLCGADAVVNLILFLFRVERFYQMLTACDGSSSHPRFYSRKLKFCIVFIPEMKQNWNPGQQFQSVHGSVSDP